jgi:hypothetical protein
MRIPFYGLLLLQPLLGAAPLALVDGESMTFRVGWGVFTHAGEISISARSVAEQGSPLLQVTMTTATRGFLHAFFPFNATGEAWYDPTTGRLLRSREESLSKKRRTSQSLDLDYATRMAAYRNAVRPDRDAELTIPEGNPMDLITSLVQTRAWDLKPGEKQDALVIFDDDFYELTIYADTYEDVRTPLGKFKTLRLTPRMEKTEPKGMFKRGSEVHVWISQDGRRLPVKFQVEFKFGAGVATLIEHHLRPTPGSASAEEPMASPKPEVQNEENPGS